MHPISEILFTVYDKLHEQGQIGFPLYEKQKEAIDSIVKTVNANYFGLNRYPTTQDRAAAYLCFVIKDHAVTDGNKRLALLWFEVYCQVHDLKPSEPPGGMDTLAVAIEKSREEMGELIASVKKILFK